MSWFDLASGQGGTGPFLIILGLITLLLVLLWWAIRRFRRTYRWYLTRGNDEEDMSRELEMRQSIAEEYLEGGEDDNP